ncbi:hypothetical protein MTO96_019374 [Rhipicephalus appendiculatus]
MTSSVMALDSTSAAVVEDTQPKGLPGVSAEAQFMTTAPEVGESDSTAVTALELQSTTTSGEQQPQFTTRADVAVKSHCVTAAGAEQELQSPTTPAPLQEPLSMALAHVAAGAKSIAAPGAAQESLSTTSTATELQSTSAAAVMEAPQSALPDVVAETHCVNVAPEARESEPIAETDIGLQSTTTTSTVQESQTIMVADGSVECDSMRAAKTVQESQSTMMEEPHFEALPHVALETLFTSAAPEAHESDSRNAAAIMQEPDAMTDDDVIIESTFMIAAGPAQESPTATVPLVELKLTPTVAIQQELQPMTSARLTTDCQPNTSAEAEQEPQSSTVTAMKHLTCELSVTIPLESQCATAMVAKCEFPAEVIAATVEEACHLTGHELLFMATIDMKHELDFTSAVFIEHELQSVTDIGKREQCELMSVVDTVQELQTATSAGVLSESQCNNSVSSVTGFTVDCDSKSTPGFEFPDLEEKPQVEEENRANIPVCPATMRTSKLVEAAEYCPAVSTEPIRETDNRNTATSKDLTSNSPSEKCISKSASMQAASVSDMLAEKTVSCLATDGDLDNADEITFIACVGPEETVSCLATDGDVDSADEITVIAWVRPEETVSSLATDGDLDNADEITFIACVGPESSCDSDADGNLCKQVISVPDEALVPFTRNVSMANEEVSGTMFNKSLELDLQTLPQASEDAVTSSAAAHIYSTNELTDNNTVGRVKQGISASIERDNPFVHHISSRRSNASICSIRRAVERPTASSIQTQALLPRKVAVSSATGLRHSLGNLATSKRHAIERNERDSICKRGLPSISPQSCSSAQKRGRHVSSCVVSTPVAKAATGKNSRPTVSTNTSGSRFEPTWTGHRDMPGRSSALVNTESTKCYAARHLFNPSQGRYIVKKEVLQDEDGLDTGAVLCTVAWAPSGGAAKP